ncbi:MAG: hypothetical protein Q9163_001667 [Psora crenata]
MNRLLGQQQPKLHTNSPPSASTDFSSARSPTPTTGTKDLPKVVRTRSPSDAPPKRAQSPIVANQALNPAVSRKAVESRGRKDSGDKMNKSSSSSNNGNSEQKYQFDQTPDPSAHNSAMELQIDPQVKLDDYDWAELEEQFTKRMEAFRAEEDGIWEEWKGWGEIFEAWAATVSVHDEERAAKRLRTRIAFTQGSEESLEAKRQHYIRVVQAFESALALLANRNSAHNFL